MWLNGFHFVLFFSISTAIHAHVGTEKKGYWWRGEVKTRIDVFVL